MTRHVPRQTTSIPNWLFGLNLGAELKFAYSCLQHLAQQRKATGFTDTRARVVALVMAIGTWRDDEQVRHLIEALWIAELLDLRSWIRTDPPQPDEAMWTIGLTQPGREALEKLSPENASLLYGEICALARAYGCTFEEKAREGAESGTDGIILYGETRHNIGPYQTARWWGRKQWERAFEQAVREAGE